MDPQRSRSAGQQQQQIDALFSGNKAKWLPLYRRLVARLSRIPGVEIVPSRTNVAVAVPGNDFAQMAQIRITASGLDFRMALAKAQLKSPRLKAVASRSASGAKSRAAMSHQTLLAMASDLDDELMLWLKAAKRLAGDR